MKDLFRETAFGRLVRLISRGKLFAYEEELNPLSIQKYQPNDSGTSSTSTSLPVDGKQTQPNDGQETPIALDREKGSDHLLVDWNLDDPQNPRNWSTPKKLFVTFQICLLTTSVYIGSAIYTAGLEGIEAQFHVSPVKALLGLTLFVIGYALGPMVWVCSCSFFAFSCPRKKNHPNCSMLTLYLPRRHPCPRYPT